MKDTLMDERLSAHLNHLRKLIKVQGYALQSIQAQPSFTHTVGLSASNVRADIMIAGTSVSAIQWLHRFVNLALTGSIELIEGKSYASDFGGADVHIRRLLPRQTNRLLRTAVIVADPIEVRGFILCVAASGVENHETILREDFLHSPALDERNLR